MHNCPLLASKQTSARIDFLRQGGLVVRKNGTHNVKICAEKLTKQLRVYMCMVNGTEGSYAYGRQCERLKGMHFLSRIGAVFSNSVTIFYSIYCLSKKVLLPLPL